MRETRQRPGGAAHRSGGPDPVAGYVSVPAHASDTDARTEVTVWRRVLARYAAQRGMRLAALFTDIRGRTETGMYDLVEHLHAGHAVAVIAPDLAHLTHTGCLTGADLPATQRFLHARVLTMHTGHRTG